MTTPPNTHTHPHTLTKQENSSKNTCQNQGCFALDCQLVGNTIERLAMMLSQQIKNRSSILSLVFPANNSHQTVNQSRAISQPWFWRMTIRSFCCWLFLFLWYKNFISTFVVSVGCLWYWWLKILHKDYPVNRLYWRKENQKSIVRDSNWLLFLCLYDAPHDNKNSTHPLSFYISIMTHPYHIKN